MANDSGQSEKSSSELSGSDGEKVKPRDSSRSPSRRKHKKSKHSKRKSKKKSSKHKRHRDRSRSRSKDRQSEKAKTFRDGSPKEKDQVDLKSGSKLPAAELTNQEVSMDVIASKEVACVASTNQSGDEDDDHAKQEIAKHAPANKEVAKYTLANQIPGALVIKDEPRSPNSGKELEVSTSQNGPNKVESSLIVKTETAENKLSLSTNSEEIEHNNLEIYDPGLYIANAKEENELEQTAEENASAKGKRSKSRSVDKSESKDKRSKGRRSRSDKRRSRSKESQTKLRGRRSRETRSRSKERSKLKKKSGSRSRSRRSRDRSIEKSRQRSKDRSRERSTEYSRKRSRSVENLRKNKVLSKERSVSKDKSSSPKKSKERSVEKPKQQDKKRSISKKRSKSQDRCKPKNSPNRKYKRSRACSHSRQKSSRRSKSKEHQRSKSRERPRSESRERPISKSKERPRSKSRERPRSKSRECPRSKSREGRSKSREHQRSKAKECRRSKSEDHRKSKSKESQRSKSREDRRSKSREDRRSKSRERHQRSTSRKWRRRSKSLERRRFVPRYQNNSRFRRSRSNDRWTRSRSKSFSRRRRSRSNERRRRSRSPARRRRSESRSRNHQSRSRYRSRSRSPRKRSCSNDRKRRSNSADATAASVPVNLTIALGVPTTSVTTTTASVKPSKSIADFTELCKKLTEEKEEERNELDENTVENKNISQVYHPFSVKPAKEIVIPPVILPIPKPVEPARPLEQAFPVSSGNQHKTKEGTTESVVEGVDGSVAAAEKVFQAAAQQEKLDVSGLIAKRMEAQNRLQSNPNDYEASLVLEEVQMKIQNWASVNLKPGQYTGESLVNSLTPKENINSGYQAWARKDMFHNLTPIRGGVGMKLLQKMGWRPGQILGKRGEGSYEPIALSVKTDRKGLVSFAEAGAKGKGGGKGGGKNILAAQAVQGKHPVSALAELCTKKRWKAPAYNVAHESGPSHKKDFLYQVTINGISYQHNISSNNKKLAKAEAAFAALKALGVVPADATMSL